MWHGLANSTRTNYNRITSRIYQWSKLYFPGQSICAPTTHMIQSWIIDRIYGNHGLARVSGGTISGDLSAWRSLCVDCNLPHAELKTLFNSPQVQRMKRAAHSMNPPQSNKYLPILPPMLNDMLTKVGHSLDDYNDNAAMTLAFAGCMRIGELSYSTEEAALEGFATTHLTRGDVTLADDHMIVRLKRSKTDTEHRGVSIYVAATGTHTCAVSHMRVLLDKQPTTSLDQPLFALNTGAFTYHRLLASIRSRLQRNGHDPRLYACHSLRRGAAQHAANQGLTYDEIQALGRWSSNACERYFTYSPATLYHMNKRFQTGIPPPLNGAV